MDWLRRVMAGRYGLDQLTVALFVAGLVISILGGIIHSGLVQLIAYVPMGYGLFRSFSRKIGARRSENTKFLLVYNRVKVAVKPLYFQIRDIRTYRYYRCPTCKTWVRVPRGRGKICITCPKCRNGFIKKT